MGHRDPSGFHGVIFVVVKFAYLLVVEVGHLSAVQHAELAIIIKNPPAIEPFNQDYTTSFS